MIAILTHLVAIDPLQRVEDCGQRQNAKRQPLRRVELAQALHSSGHAARGGRHEELVLSCRGVQRIKKGSRWWGRPRYHCCECGFMPSPQVATAAEIRHACTTYGPLSQAYWARERETNTDHVMKRARCDRRTVAAAVGC